jgi:hypothetical protein
MSLIEHPKTRALYEYYKRHHVVPRFIGGSDESSNLMAVMLEERYIEHFLLMKIFSENGALVSAAFMMCVDSPSTPRKNKSYAWATSKTIGHH